jgi:small GTP-binding protein
VEGVPRDAVKLIILGNTQVGKTQLISNYIEGVFDEDGIATIAVDHSMKQVIVDSEAHKISLWDRAGQDRYRSIVRTYYRGTHGVILVYDVTSQESFDSLESWFNEIESAAPAGVPVVLVGNKVDLPEVIPAEQA